MTLLGYKGNANKKMDKEINLLLISLGEEPNGRLAAGSGMALS